MKSLPVQSWAASQDCKPDPYGGCTRLTMGGHWHWDGRIVCALLREMTPWYWGCYCCEWGSLQPPEGPASNKATIISAYATWAARYNTWLLIKLTPKGVVLSCLVLSCLILSYLILSYLILSYLILSYLILSLPTQPPEWVTMQQAQEVHIQTTQRLSWMP